MYGKIPFLDRLIARDNNTLRRTIYRKPTNTVYLLITRPVIVQPNLSQGYNCTDFDETSATSFRLA